MMKPPEQIGSIPQPGVNPQVAQQYEPTPEDIDFFRHDPEIIAAVRKVVGRDVDMEIITPPMLVGIAGMVHKLGVDGAVAEFLRATPPADLKRIQRRLAVHSSLAPKDSAVEGNQ